ncbi:MAG: FG-GAP-like repeat-containing protein, partial [Myxococcota bacterium]
REPVDLDGDGSSAAEDCDDADPNSYPGAPEACDGKDNNCDGTVAEDDADRDGVPWCLDCADTEATQYPGAPDPLGDGLDQDCDGTDGVGERLLDPVYGFLVPYASYGLAVAAADLDGDGCAEWMAGAPGYPVGTAAEDGFTVAAGCAGVGAAPVPWMGTGWGIGTRIDLRPGRVLVAENGYEGTGRVLVFDAPLLPSSAPRLEIFGQGLTDDFRTGALLGPAGEWVLLGSQGGSFSAEFVVVDASRSGQLELEAGGEPDYRITTDAADPATGWYVSDVGDRDGDGQVDLGLGSGYPSHNALYLFPHLQDGHMEDAPEVWHGETTYPGWGTALYTTGAADLDGDGLDDAVSANPLAEGAVLLAGRVYVVPWRGPGDFTLETDAAARIEGELAWESTGTGLAIGDLDRDGQADLVVGAPGNENVIGFPGRVNVFLGPLTGTLTRADAARVWVGELGDYAGPSVAVGDIDGSGALDLVIGAPFRDGPDGEGEVGAVYVVRDPL